MPLYVRTTGSHNGTGAPNSPFLSASDAYAVASAGSANYIIILGTGNFGTIDTHSNNWPARISVQGQGESVSSYSIVANGTTGEAVPVTLVVTHAPSDAELSVGYSIRALNSIVVIGDTN